MVILWAASATGAMGGLVGGSTGRGGACGFVVDMLGAVDDQSSCGSSCCGCRRLRP